MVPGIQRCIFRRIVLGDTSAVDQNVDRSQLANRGIIPACKDLPPLASAVNIRAGSVTNQAVAETFGMKLGW